MGDKQNDRKQFWIWVVDPEHYLDDKGNEWKGLEPGGKGKGDNWWTCHEGTRRGDLALIWRSKCSDIRYLVRAESEARSIANDPNARAHGWKWGCDWRVLYKFENPVKIKDIRFDSDMHDWGAFRANFRRHCYAIPLKHWRKITRLASERNPGYLRFIESIEKGKVSRPPVSTRELEDTIATLGENPYYQKALRVLRLIQRRHNELSNDFTRWLKKTGYTDIHQERERIDVEFLNKRRLYCAELKICYSIGSTKAMRHALGQLLEYNYYPGRKHAKQWAIVLDERPSDDDIRYAQALKGGFGFPLSLGWRDNTGFSFADRLSL